MRAVFQANVQAELRPSEDVTSTKGWGASAPVPCSTGFSDWLLESMRGRIEVAQNLIKAHLREVFYKQPRNSDLYLHSFGDTSSYNDSLSVEKAIEIGCRKFHDDQLALIKSM